LTAKNKRQELIDELGKILIGKEEQITLLMAAVFSGGHVLLEDLPGSGKTTLIKGLSRAMGCDFRRIQFTPDLLPSDIVGMTVYDQKNMDFKLRKGPVFTNMLLADELNRAIPRTQSALLEAMEERQVTIDGETLELPAPFFVMATQNPVEKESTFPLPAAQMDRFFVRMSMGYPDQAEEVAMLRQSGSGIPFASVKEVLNKEELEAIREEIERVYVSDDVRRYLVELVHRTRNTEKIENGASPRASKALYQGSRAWAAMQGRDYVIPDDVQALAVPVLAHRITLKSRMKHSGMAAEAVIREILAETPVIFEQ